ncbi:MAG: hypothetical protein JJ892_00025 [Balneola sp.]|nr:hypothetical protein [Balneola sp.]MBO6652231.1 hypothetical protein [Balneola sp.]MBO6709948.1 hypothetical protein [Balneola sp.]MBO6798632.1 hypothetical protein [Balneola sp.]MBO6871897.1 hypothetical protein [Balneola sp.]
MSSQRFKNELRGDQDDPDFDLDAYLQEQSHPDEQFEEQINDSPKSSFIKNTFFILGLSIFALLYFNDWSPKLVYGNIFGVEEYQKQTVAPDPVIPATANSEPDVVITDSDLAAANDIVVTQGLENLARLEALEALESLEGLAELENLEGLEGLEELAKLSALEGLKALSNLENPSFIQVENNSTEFPATLEDYNIKLNEAGLSDKFGTETVAELFAAKVPVPVLKTLNDNDLLNTFDISSLIEGYKHQGN